MFSHYEQNPRECVFCLTILYFRLMNELMIEQDYTIFVGGGCVCLNQIL